MQDINPGNITTDQLSLPLLDEKKLEVDVLRLDKIHPLVSGNKWFKLRYYLQEAATTAKKTIVTRGGAWSNHILATAAACKINGFKAVGIIRGEEAPVLSSTLVQAKELGMQLLFISREAFSNRYIPEYIHHDEAYFIPEGGYGAKGAGGAATILDHCDKETYNYICCAAGTGTMTAGLVNAATPGTKVMAISVLKNHLELEATIRQLTGQQEHTFEVLHDYHFGGYARHQPELIAFMNEWYRQTSIPSDFVYTGKLFFAIHDLIQQNFFLPGSRILIIHSGGLQGNASFDKGTLIF